MLDWSRHLPIARERFGLNKLVEVTDLDLPTIQRWHHRGVVKVRRVGTGKVRAYTIWDALGLCIAAELTRLGVSLRSRGIDLPAALLACVRLEIQCNGSPEGLGAIALIPVEGGRDWYVERRVERAVESGGSFVVVGLREIVEGLVKRVDAS